MIDIFNLSQLLAYEGIVIQCHDNPDADALASAFAVYTYLRLHGKSSRMIYSGRYSITKSNLREMIDEFGIPVQFVKEFYKIETLVVVDSQYGAGNITKFEAENVVVIDHHREEKHDYGMGVINSQLSSCSTLVWDLLRKEGFPFEEQPEVSTALYYGLFTDTSGLQEIFHPLDKDTRDTLVFNKFIIKRLLNANISIDELLIAGKTLTQGNFNIGMRYAIFKADPCDPNILGFISDLALQVDGYDVCVVYNEISDGAKLSIRSCAHEVMASDFATFITADVGSGGGHIDKAGGFIPRRAVEEMGYTLDGYINEKIEKYFVSYDVIYSSSHNLDVESMPKYCKKRIPVGYVPSTDVFDEGTFISIRSLEGDQETVASQNVFFMIGIMGEVYPIKAENFYKCYESSDESIETNYSYNPTVKNKTTGEIRDIVGLIKVCSVREKSVIHAKRLEKHAKVFTTWNVETYMNGFPGDFLAVRASDHNDVYIIKKMVFEKTYEPVPEGSA